MSTLTYYRQQVKILDMIGRKDDNGVTYQTGGSGPV